MKNMLKIELTKALKNKYFVICVVVASLIACFSAVYMIDSYFEFMETVAFGNKQNPDFIEEPALALGTFYRYRLGVEFMSLAGSVFYFLVPFFAALAYGWSYFIDSKGGYVKNVITRTSRMNYYLSKYVAVFISGGLVILIPLLVNSIVVAMYVPMITPDIFYDSYYGINVLDMWSSLFFTAPFLHMILYMFLSFIFGGLLATMSYAISFFIRNRYAVVLFPILFFLGVSYLEGFRDQFGNPNEELSPNRFLQASNPHNDNIWWVILLVGLVLFLVPVFIVTYKGVKDDVF